MGTEKCVHNKRQKYTQGAVCRFCGERFDTVKKVPILSLNNVEVRFGRYPNRELYLPIDQLAFKDLKEGLFNIIKFNYNTNEDLVKLLILKGILKDFNTNAILYISYFPYSRMDRFNGDYSFSLRPICHFINSLKFIKVIVREPHSPVIGKLINNFEEDPWCLKHIKTATVLSGSSSIFFPDYGARERYYTNDLDIPIAYGKKKRDFKSGILSEDYTIVGDVKMDVLIVDDLCSRGGTFILATKELHKANPYLRRVSLLVSYCEENVFTGDIFNYIDKIYTSSESGLIHPRITLLY